MTRVADLRYRGQSHELRIAVGEDPDLARLFHRSHEQAYGYAMPAEPVTVVTLRAVAQGRPALAEPPREWEQGEPAPERSREIGLAGGTATARIVSRAALAVGDTVAGPALIEQPDTTTLLHPGETGVVDEAGNLVVRVDG